MDYTQHIETNPQICEGQPIMRGTRIPVRTILASLAHGDSMQEILDAFPTLKEKDVRAIIAFAAASAEEDMPVLSIPRIK